MPTTLQPGYKVYWLNPVSQQEIPATIKTVYKNKVKLIFKDFTTETVSIDDVELASLKKKPTYFPFYEDYLRIKKDYPDAIVLYQNDPFLEAYGEDADRLAQELDLVKTQKTISEDGKRAIISGFPKKQIKHLLELQTKQIEFKIFIEGGDLLDLEQFNLEQFALLKQFFVGDRVRHAVTESLGTVIQIDEKTVTVEWEKEDGRKLKGFFSQQPSDNIQAIDSLILLKPDLPNEPFPIGSRVEMEGRGTGTVIELNSVSAYIKWDNFEWEYEWVIKNGFGLRPHYVSSDFQSRNECGLTAVLDEWKDRKPVPTPQISSNDLPDNEPAIQISSTDKPDNLPDNEPAIQISSTDKPDNLPDNEPAIQISSTDKPDNLPDNEPAIQISSTDKPDNLPDNEPAIQISSTDKPDNLPDNAECTPACESPVTGGSVRGKIYYLPLKDLQLDGATQQRVKIDLAHVKALEEQLEEGTKELEPIVVFLSEDGNHWVADGFHRVKAYQNQMVQDIPCRIIEGTRRDAILYSVGANADHQPVLPRTNADKRRAVETLLNDPEWSQWSDREIARNCKVSDRFVNSVRKSICAYSQMPDKIKVSRNGKEYEMSRAKPEPDAPLTQSVTQPQSEDVTDEIEVAQKTEAVSPQKVAIDLKEIYLGFVSNLDEMPDDWLEESFKAIAYKLVSRKKLADKKYHLAAAQLFNLLREGEGCQNDSFQKAS